MEQIVGQSWPLTLPQLVYSLLFHCRMEMAEFFWERIEDAVCGGIVASKILKGMASLSKDPDEILDAEKNAG